MRLWTDTLFRRLMLIMLAVLITSHIAAAWLFHLTVQSSHAEQFRTGIVETIRLLRHALPSMQPGPLPPAGLPLAGPRHAFRLLPGDLPPPAPAFDEPRPLSLERLFAPAPPPGQQAGPDGNAALPPPLRDIARLDPALEVRGGGPGRAFWLGFRDDAGRRFWLEIHPPKPPEGGLQLLLNAGLLTLLALAGAWLLFRQVDRPLARLVDALRQVGRGQSPGELPESGPKELRELANSFNRMVEDSRRLKQDRDTLLAGVSHDLRTPITRLKLRAEILDEDTRAGFARDVDDIARIAEQFLDFARGDAPDSQGLVCVLSDVLQEVQQAYADRAVRVDCPLPSPCLLAVPATALQRALTNLLDNALAYGAPPVELTGRAGAGRVTLTVRDHGGGIPPDRRDAALQPFVRLDPSRGGHGHCGLGLAIVAQFARRHGGELQLDNAPGGGLEVRLILPQALPAPGGM